ncbi:MAG: ParB/RepB/Spo0J family partition protein [Flavobacteriaceae bacterium]|jgi:ParB family chromosome partitioning protein|nr:ParB/RepB/Spo0J family partition protein [Flavobacteriaceae bacterium]MBT3753711.1 ParB/RepB/Spo0J family partition protein [Flavobacteriaceae bacterium]MBT3794623.1 ParB/RepB/Spo0J family partition protein [Flavobacteriaceae bacterium]MBT4062560.1 ParB/RepB/Spo0J family partition protein [Flavobacteriaceae bacterium]MBT4415008.1 ParB/RepB/Spo0J family partition protein [Flavobacteriaceae bacterium]|tara:strand:- start:3590 stop:4486 length:897 start_codon:yes stop_codon:yes gene_type:complete
MAKAYNKQSLGRGLSALLNNPIKDISSAEDKNADQVIGNIIEIPINQIELNPFQPRTNFENEKISELANSIEQLGIIQPITVRKTGFKSFQIISGERRFRAVSLLNLQSIPAFIRIANDQQSLEMALVENIQRENLDPIEIALCYQRLIDDVKLTQEQMSSRVGKKRSTISNYLRLLKLDPIIQTGIRDGFISMGHGRTLVTIENRDDQLKIYKKILSDSLSVRETENIRNRLKSDSKEISIVKKKLPEPFKSNLNKLKKIFNSEVKITLNGNKKGSIIIPFNNIEDYKTLNKKLNSD